MKFDDKHSFDKPAATVIRMFTDSAFFENKYKALGFGNIEVLEHEKSATKFRIKVRYHAVSNAPVPEFAKKFLAGATVVTQEDVWDIKTMTGHLLAEIKGVPVKVAADMTLKDEGKGSINNLKWNISSGIPLLGGKLEQLVAGDIKAKAERDVATARKLLAAY
jgi:hypothetical protein